MMGMPGSVKEIIETVPGIQSHTGPQNQLFSCKERLEAKNISSDAPM
jgi:hypothetical protein